MTRTRIARLSAAALAIALAGATAGLLAPAAQAASTIEADSWDALPAKVTSAQEVWVPTNTIGMDFHPTTGVTAEKCGAAYSIQALYGGGTAVEKAPSFDISQVGGDACDLAPHTFFGLVKKVTTKNGTFAISAGCGWDAKKDKPVAGYDGGPCTKKDVKAKGGLITLLSAKPGGTAVQVETDGLSFGQVVAIAKGLKPLG